jgi:hypothetical protein
MTHRPGVTLGSAPPPPPIYTANVGEGKPGVAHSLCDLRFGHRIRNSTPVRPIDIRI